MNHPLITTATALADLLASENAALAAQDHTAATALVAAKRAATGAFATAHATLAAAGGTLDADLRHAAEAAAARLHDLASQNRLLLERAVSVQGAVIGVIARAAPALSADAPRYGAAGRLVDAHRAIPVALSANI